MLRRKIVDHADARSCLDAAAASGLTRYEWARANDIDGRSLQGWWLALESQGPPTPTPTPTPATPMRMVELVAAQPPSAPSATYVVRCGALAVEIDHRFDDEVLRRLLAVVASC